MVRKHHQLTVYIVLVCACVCLHRCPIMRVQTVHVVQMFFVQELKISVHCAYIYTYLWSFSRSFIQYKPTLGLDMEHISHLALLL